MIFKGVNIVEEYIVVYYQGRSTWTGHTHRSKEEALKEMEERAYDAVYNTNNSFDYAEIETKYIPVEGWDWDEE